MSFVPLVQLAALQHGGQPAHLASQLLAGVPPEAEQRQEPHL